MSYVFRFSFFIQDKLIILTGEFVLHCKKFGSFCFFKTYSDFGDTFWSLATLVYTLNFSRPKVHSSQIWNCAVIGLCFSELVSANIHWGGLRDEPKECLRGRLGQLCLTTVESPSLFTEEG